MEKKVEFGGGRKAESFGNRAPWGRRGRRLAVMTAALLVIMSVSAAAGEVAESTGAGGVSGAEACASVADSSGAEAAASVESGAGVDGLASTTCAGQVDTAAAGVGQSGVGAASADQLTAAAGVDRSGVSISAASVSEAAAARISSAATTATTGLLVNFKVGDSWESGGSTFTKWDVSLLNNTGSATGSWRFSVPVSVSGIENCWNCSVTQSGGGLAFASADYNGTIAAGAELTGPGCILKTSGSGTKLAGTWLAGASGASYLGAGGLSDYANGSTSGSTGSGSSAGVSQPGSASQTGTSGTTATLSAATIKSILRNPAANARLVQALTKVRNIGCLPWTTLGTRLLTLIQKPQKSGGSTASSTGGAGSSATTPAASGTPLATHGALSVSGTKLVDKNGQAFRLKGVSTHGLAWFPAYVNKDAFRTLRDDWGANLVRLAMYSAEYNGYCTGGDRAQLKSLIDTGVSAATDLGMYVIIDWHILSDGDPNTHKAEAKAFFAEMSAKYATHDNVLYEICNEPNGTTWDSVRAYANEVIPVIRANDPDAIIIVGTPTWSQDVDQVAASPVANGSNVMYALHFYAATHGDNIRNKAIRALAAGTPLFVTEFSICDASGNGGIDYNSAAAWKQLMDKYGLSFAGWSLSNKAETSALINSGCSKTSGWSTSDLSETGRWLRDLCKAS